jgi:hypothetical protein
MQRCYRAAQASLRGQAEMHFRHFLAAFSPLFSIVWLGYGQAAQR